MKELSLIECPDKDFSRISLMVFFLQALEASRRDGSPDTYQKICAYLLNVST
jgi:hypothetical protein